MDDGTSEEWRAVADYEGLYLVSNLGRVRSLPRNTTSGRIMKLFPDRHGYLYVTLTRDGKQKRRPVHQIVMEAFDKPCPPGMEVRHLDGNPANNRWAPGDEEETVAAGGNLFYGTRGQNMMDAVRHGTHPTGSVTRCPKGHDYTPQNTRILKSGSRACKECARDKNREYMRARYVPRAAWITCRYCGKPFERQPGMSPNRKYCSDECFIASRQARQRRYRAA
jgi:hypothetical protein